MSMTEHTPVTTQQAGVPAAAAIQLSLAQVADEAAAIAARVRHAAREADARCRHNIATEPLKASVIAAGIGAVVTMTILGVVRRARAKHRL